MDDESDSRGRVSAISATFPWPIHQAFSFAFALAFAAASFGGLGVSTVLGIAAVGGSKCANTQSAPLLHLPFLWKEHTPL